MGLVRDCRCRAAEQALHRPGQVFLDVQSQFLPSTRPKHPPPLSSEVVLQYLARCLRGQQLPLLWISNTSSGQLDSQFGRGQCRLVDVDRIPPANQHFPAAASSPLPAQGQPSRRPISPDASPGLRPSAPPSAVALPLLQALVMARSTRYGTSHLDATLLPSSPNSSSPAKTNKIPQ